MQIILFQPQIPQNTGNIIRTCKAINAKLALVKPLGFSLNERHMKRAGLDYCKDFEIELIDDLPLYLKKNRRPFFFFSSKAKRSYTEISYPPDPILIFGSETTGLPLSYFDLYPEQFITLPMAPGARCLNLSNTVAIAAYEARRQHAFSFL